MMNNAKEYCNKCAIIHLLAVREINAYLTKKLGKLSPTNQGEFSCEYENLIYRFNVNLETFLHDIGVDEKEFKKKVKKITGGKNA